MGEAAEVLEVRLVPAVITVNSLADTDTNDPGSFSLFNFRNPGTNSDSVLTFREALRIVNSGSMSGYSVFESLQVNTSTSPLGTNDTIQFAPSLTASGPQTISMTGGGYGILRNVRIDGPGADKLSLDADHKSRVFNNPFSNITWGIGGLTLKNGKDATGDGGVIRNSGSLTLALVTIDGGQAAATGGGIFNNGTLSLSNSTIRNSIAITGGAIENLATLIVTASTIEQNVARLGAGINNTGSVTVTNSEFASNVAQPDLFGVILGVGSVGGQGGGINNQAGQVTVRGSTFVGNRAEGGTAKGGAINNNNNGRLNVLNSTISENAATSGGGIFNGATTFIYNSTLFGNLSTQEGGAIFNQANLTLANATITNNFAVSGGGLFTKVFNSGPSASSAAFNTIISGNLSLPDNNNQRSPQNLGGQALATRDSFNDLNLNNLVGTDVTMIFETENGVPKLADNGGLTKTVALKVGGLAFNQGLAPGDIPKVIELVGQIPGFAGQSARDELFATDQRGTLFTRKFGEKADIGAFEFNQQTSLEVTASGPSGSAVTSDRVTLTFTVKNTSNVTANNVRFMMTIPNDIVTASVVGTVNNLAGSGIAGIGFVGRGGGGVGFGVGGGSVESGTFTIPPSQTAQITFTLTLKQSAAGNTLPFNPVVTTETFHTPISLPTLSLPVLALPTLPAFSGISHDAGGNQTSVGRTVSYSLRIPPTMNGGQTAQIDPNTVSAADFKIVGTAQAQIGSVGAGDESIGLTVNPTGFGGTFSLAFADNAEIKDTFGRTITLAMPSDNSTIDVTGPLVVSQTGDVVDSNFSDGQLSLREAVQLANGRAGSDTIRFKPGLGSITLTAGQLELTDTETLIFGPVDGTQVIERSSTDTNQFRLFQIATGAKATFFSLTLQNGSTAGNGGAILNLGSLVIELSTLGSNAAMGHGGAIFNGGGTNRSLNLVRSTLSNNTADRGGAIFNDNGRGNSKLNVRSSTISGNLSRSHGGGIANFGNLELLGSTIVLNRSDSDGENGGEGGGLAAFNSENLTNTIIAGNLTAG